MPVAKCNCKPCKHLAAYPPLFLFFATNVCSQLPLVRAVRCTCHFSLHLMGDPTHKRHVAHGACHAVPDATQQSSDGNCCMLGSHRLNTDSRNCSTQMWHQTASTRCSHNTLQQQVLTKAVRPMRHGASRALHSNPKAVTSQLEVSKRQPAAC